MQLTQLFQKYEKILLWIIFISVLFATIISNIPVQLLEYIIAKYSQNKLHIYNTNGTFWHGTGLLVTTGRNGQSAPITFISWKVVMGLKKYVTIVFAIGNDKIADMYLNSQGFNVDNVNLSLSLSQVTQISDLIKTLNLSGNMNINTNHLLITPDMKNSNGIIKINLTDVASSISPVNPLGSYSASYNINNGSIVIDTTNPNMAVLNAKGNGDSNSLSINARIAPDKKDKMLQLMTVMGVQQADGSYMMKVY